MVTQNVPGYKAEAVITLVDLAWEVMQHHYCLIQLVTVLPRFKAGDVDATEC